jgi:hypothetical protein
VVSDLTVLAVVSQCNPQVKSSEFDVAVHVFCIYMISCLLERQTVP